jgi:hypothetical protein
MEKLKKILLFYILGTIFAYWMLAIIHLNYPLLKDFFGVLLGGEFVKMALFMAYQLEQLFGYF